MQPEHWLWFGKVIVYASSENAYVAGEAVENLSIDLSKMQTTFFKSRIWIDFRGQLGVNWYTPENYESIKIKFKVNRRDDSLKPDTCTMNAVTQRCR